MFPFGQHPCFSHTEEDRRIVLENAGVTEPQLKLDVEAIRTWMQKQPHLAHIDLETRMVEQYIINAKGSVEKTKQRIDIHFREMHTSPITSAESRFKMLDARDKPVWNAHIFAPAAKLFNGSRLTYIQVYDWAAADMLEMCITASMLLDIRFCNDYCSGDIYIYDIKNTTLANILTLDFITLSRGFWQMKQGLGVRIKQIIVINCKISSIAQAILSALKPLFSKKIIERIEFHETDEKIKEYFPKECLLEDYGGDLPSFDAYKVIMEKLITSAQTKEFLFDILKLKADESKRPKSEYNENHLQGHFKKLEID